MNLIVVERECLSCGTVQAVPSASAGAPRYRMLVFDCPACAERFEVVEAVPEFVVTITTSPAVVR